jgi:uncharacterized protein (DUF433 family)
MGERACVRGMHVTVPLIVNLAVNGMSTEEIFDFVRQKGAST